MSGTKSTFLSQYLQVVSYKYGLEGRQLLRSKIVSILEQQDYRSTKEARSFLGICTYYRMFIFYFSTIAEPIFRLLRKDTIFVQKLKQQNTIDLLKIALIIALVLVLPDYGPDTKELIIIVDALGEGFGVTFYQVSKDGYRYPIRYNSSLQTKPKRKYDTVKLECRALLYILKRLRPYLYRVHFIVETNTNTLIAQLNRTATDLPSTLVTRQIVQIQMFDFDIRYVPGKKNLVADTLSRKANGPLSNVDSDLNNQVADQLNAVYFFVRLI